MPKSPCILVAMSGGVDSSVAALLLAREGHTVLGATMETWCPSGPPPATRRGGCCNLEAARDAAAVCERLGVPHQVVGLREAFEQEVIAPFVADYGRGRTPNPCLNCNRYLKWGRLAAWAQARGATHLATGHYARIERGADGQFHLLRGVDRAKDQSYALYMLRQGHLERTLLPLGDLTKSEVRRLAAEAGLPVAGRAESQEICFVADDDHFAFVSERRPEAATPGPILNLAGQEVGRHRGIAAYTVGQRRGLGLGGPARHFVVEIDAARQAVIVGEEADTEAREVLVEETSYTGGRPTGAFEAEVMTRYRGQLVPATVVPQPEGRAAVRFHDTQRAPAPGQAAVFYRGEEVLGGGIIAAVVAWANRGGAA